ncbi:MAG: HD-GYP domain-containing protein, partial [Candidatus Limnocylindria bacterium]
EREALRVAAVLRDIGMLGIDRRVLDAPGALSAERRAVVARHPLLGESILATIGLAPAARIVRAHHERFDGTGYPDRLAGEAIPLGGRILAVADAFVAMTTERAYRGALRPAEALAALLEGRGRAYDPRVVDTLVRLGEAGTVSLAATSAVAT